jgi:hypothetical protein
LRILQKLKIMNQFYFAVLFCSSPNSLSDRSREGILLDQFGVGGC